MKELTNKDIYDFLTEEIACHPELSDKFGCNLKEHKGDDEFWEELSENLDCVTICDICGKPMIEGYIMNGSHYCSDTCLHEDFSDEQIAELCTEEFLTNLSAEILEEMHSFTMTEVEYRLAWAKTYLKNFGAIENSKHRVWSLTSKGAKMLKESNIDVKEICSFGAKKQGKANVSPEEVLVENESVNWRDQITDILQHLDPYAFERLAQRLLRECGFSDVQVTKRSGDGGIDGTGKLRIQGIFSFNVAFQCKRYKGQVGAAEIRDFRGSLDTNIEKGVLITTGAFTKAAKEEASCPGKRLIDLMDGEELINKLAEYGIGLNEVKSYEVDEDFFNSLVE